ncbi:hypothetical protein K435DRAFT_864688 [Dendrothele bispora CBS 962.96]|uniref:Uncharacterized protein n=1 Tax=Dendrothele bispora (strain CBS 962.96) TaxID=1314807 RepID=A0A4S8LLF8_DENBC|nr:hypothetical protein K435DRAFT_864688 [Dendrothele bispora CBS 962.96]
MDNRQVNPAKPGSVLSLTVIQDQFKAVGMVYDTLTTFLNQSFNSSQAVTGFMNEQDNIFMQILRYASKEVPGLETFLRSTPAPIPISSNPPAALFNNSAILAGTRVNFPAPQASTSLNPLPACLNHALPPKPSVAIASNGKCNRH